MATLSRSRGDGGSCDSACTRPTSSSSSTTTRITGHTKAPLRTYTSSNNLRVHGPGFEFSVGGRMFVKGCRVFVRDAGSVLLRVWRKDLCVWRRVLVRFVTCFRSCGRRSRNSTCTGQFGSCRSHGSSSLLDTDCPSGLVRGRPLNVAWVG